MLTGDLNIIDVEWIIQYQITDARAWLFNVQDEHKTIRDISQSVINMLVGDRTIFDVIGSERATIEGQGQEMMNELYKNYGLGIKVNAVKLQNIVPPKGHGPGRLRGREQGHPGQEPADQRGQGSLQPGHPAGRRRGREGRPGGRGVRHRAREQGPGRRVPVPRRAGRVPAGARGRAHPAVLRDVRRGVRRRGAATDLDRQEPEELPAAEEPRRGGGRLTARRRRRRLDEKDPRRPGHRGPRRHRIASLARTSSCARASRPWSCSSARSSGWSRTRG